MAKIMVVDDNEGLRKAIGKLLSLSGHEVALTQDGAVALDQLRGNPVDLVLTDIYMPEMDGIEFLDHVRRTCPDTRIVAMSAGGSTPAHSLLTDARLLGAVDVISKPFSDTELVDFVERALEDPPAGSVS